MREEQARWLYLVRAIEREDTDHLLLTHEDRKQAEVAGRSVIENPDDKHAAQVFLAERSRFAASRLTTRHPAISRAVKASRWPAWLTLVLPLVAFLLGAFVNELGNGSRLNLLAFPLLGALAWNIAIYLSLIVGTIAGRRWSDDGWAGWLLRKLSGAGRSVSDSATPLARGLSSFASGWSRVSGKLNGLRGVRVLHVSAATFALGLIAGIFLRALAVEYRAGWESTFLTPEMVHALLSAVLGPASALTGIEIPDIAALADLRWRESSAGGVSGGENAGPWIILYTATALGVIVVPRLLLAGIASVRASLAARRIEVPGREDFYIRKLLRTIGSGSQTARVTAYAYRPEEDIKTKLTALVQEALGDGTGVHFDAPVDYGGEDDWRDNAATRESDVCHIALFTLSATPEEENHGQLASYIREIAPAGASVVGLVDESAYRAHFAGQAGLEERIENRREAWRGVLGKANAAPLFLHLQSIDPVEERERVEAVLMGGGTLERERHGR